MDELIAYILKLGQVDEQGIAHIREHASYMELPKDGYFSKVAHIPQQVGFILEGVIRGYYYNAAGEQVTRCFIAENSLVADYIHFEAGTRSSEYLQACTPCRLIAFEKKDWEALSHLVEGWDAIKHKMVHLCMYQKSRKGPVISQDATTRYREFMENYPTLIQRVPLSYIASYLGVTQQSLSRIRRNMQ
ncbi:Crp/Fnr family transcriptional regulator [Chitinophaga parva]|uniref:Crp/Fnr family transcriptional regulator n=1 Tax=Chitinophaga parva TaxID=2169414 RepID=A0A2T7BJI9_9BACT|nr:Crp/Fnr family transcriptional regulator [Chitinophaga parva]PUZ26422.1 Crp/Fnr family transcriptional regulator [Chitinophaga parva]